MEHSLRRAPALLGAVLLGATLTACGVDADADPAPSCFTHPQLCPRTDGGLPPNAVLISAPTGFDPYDPGGQPPVPPGDDLCPGDSVPCGERCVAPLSDPDNCGGCGLACRDDQQCRFGQCCDFDDALCAGVCTDVQSDELNCGTCGFTCDFGQECVLGSCTPEDPRGP